jgi:hypothetical protein
MQNSLGGCSGSDFRGCLGLYCWGFCWNYRFLQATPKEKENLSFTQGFLRVTPRRD